MGKIIIDPITRISGFLEIDADIDDNVVKDARMQGLLFRGFEKMLKGRNPFDAIYFTQRICGICSTAHSVASSLALEDALGVNVCEQGRYLRDFLHGCEFLQNHIRHFYQYTVPDFIKFPEGQTLFEADHDDFRLPKEKNDLIVRHYFDSFEFSRSAHEMLAILGGKAPHNHGVFLGGITSAATPEKIMRLRTILLDIKRFICECMIPDAITVSEYYSEYFNLGRGCGNLLSYGCFNGYEALGTLYLNAGAFSGGEFSKFNPNEIAENVYSSWYKADSQTLMPFDATPEPDISKSNAYSWVRAPRYMGLPFEVGPLARMWLCGEYRFGISAMDRTLARAFEAKKIANIMLVLLDNIISNVSLQKEYEIPKTALGVGLIDTTRGALGHFIKIENKVISHYRIITPSGWNLSTRGEDNLPGPGEAALIGTPIRDESSPIELGRIIRSFDPCVSCATHVFLKGEKVKIIKVVP